MATAHREIRLLVTSKKVGYAWHYNYPAGKLGIPDPYLYLVPTYQMNLQVKCPGDGDWKNVGAFEVVRFSPGIGKNRNVTIIGVRTEPVDGKGPTKDIEGWIDYEPQSGPASRGGWVIDGDRLVHDGQDYPSYLNWEIMGGDGCIEVCGPEQWQKLNEKILKAACITGPGNEERIGVRS